MDLRDERLRHGWSSANLRLGVIFPPRAGRARIYLEVPHDPLGDSDAIVALRKQTKGVVPAIETLWDKPPRITL